MRCLGIVTNYKEAAELERKYNGQHISYRPAVFGVSFKNTFHAALDAAERWSKSIGSNPHPRPLPKIEAYAIDMR